MGTKTIDIVIRAKTIDKVIRSKTIDMYIIGVLILLLLLLLLLMFLFTEQIPMNEVNQVVIPLPDVNAKMWRRRIVNPI